MHITSIIFFIIYILAINTEYNTYIQPPPTYLEANFINENNDTFKIIENGYITKLFNYYYWPCDTCVSPKLYQDNSNQEHQGQFVIKNTSEKYQLLITDPPIINSENTNFYPSIQILEKSPEVTELDDKFYNIPPYGYIKYDISINYNSQEINKDNYWSYINIKLHFLFPQQEKKKTSLNQNYKQIQNNDLIKYNDEYYLKQNYIMSFYSVREEGKKFPRFDWSLPILIIIASLCVYILARGERIRSLKTKFTGVLINWKYAIAYCLFFSLIGGIYAIDQLTSVIVNNIIVTIISIACTWFALCELFSLTKFTNMDFTIYKLFKLRHLVSAILGLTLVTCNYFFYYPWYLNDLVAFSIIATTVKIFKVTNMKDAVILMAIIVCFEVGSGIFMYIINKKISYDAIMIQQFNSPLLIGIPQIYPILYKRCSWLPLSVVIYPSVFIAYMYRFDQHRNSFAYTLLAFIGLMCGQLIWMLATVWNTHAWPISPFAFSTMFLVIIFHSLRHADFTTIWHGRFQDDRLYKPLIIDNYEKEALKHQQESTDNNQIDQSIVDSLRITKHSGIFNKNITKSDLKDQQSSQNSSDIRDQQEVNKKGQNLLDKQFQNNISIQQQDDEEDEYQSNDSSK